VRDRRLLIFMKGLLHCFLTFHGTIELRYKKYPDGWYKIHKVVCDKCGKVFE
jgi:hypothetical protein